MRNHNLILILYFALLAVFVGGLAGIGIKPDMQIIIEGMVIAAVVIAAVWLLAKVIKRKMNTRRYSGKQWFAKALGVDAEIVDAMPSRALVPYETGEVALYEDEEELPDSIVEPNGLALAPTFHPGVASLIGSMVAIFGVRRSGKSNCLSVILEELAPYHLPMLVCDTKDEYAGLVDHQHMPHGFMAGAPGASANVPENVRVHYIAVDEDHAFAFGQSIMDGSLQVVLNLKSYQTDDEAARVMCKIVSGINKWQEARPNAQRVPVEIALDEAHKWLPQQLSESNVSKDVQELLHQTFFSTIVRMGGSYGFGLLVASQRISELDKRCLQSMWQFLFKQTEDIDIKRYETKGIPREEVLSLRQGECFVFCPQALGFKVKMYQKKSPDLSQTPGLEQLAKHRQVAHAKHDMLARRRSYTGQDDVQVQAFPIDTPGETPAYIEQPKRLNDEQQMALEWWNKGRRTHREIAPAMGISENAAYRLIIQLDELGYIKRLKRAGV